jgi:NADH-quinone oxidoreductase subunit G
MLALAMRQAQRKGAKVVVIDPRPIALPFEFQHLPVGPDQVNLCLGSIIKAAVDKEMAKKLGQAAVEFYQGLPALEVSGLSLGKQISETAVDLQGSQRPIIVCGTDIIDQVTVALAADQTLLLQAMDKQAGLFYLMPGANGFGAALLSDSRRSLEQVLASIEDGTVRGLILVESDPFWGFHDGQRLDQTLDKVDCFVVLDYVNSRAVKKADVFLPSTTIYEEGGIFINQEGRVQQAPVGYSGGLPIAQVSGGDHPPRVFRSDIPGDEPRAAWQFLAELARGELDLDKAVLRENPWTWLSDGHPSLARLPSMDQLPEDGVRLNLGKNSNARFAVDWPLELKKDTSDALELILVDWTFATEELSLYSPPLAHVEKSPYLAMHLDDAAKLGLKDGDAVTLKLDRGSLEVRVGILENMARGVMILPRHRLLAWQKIEALPKMVSFEDIKKTSV